MTLQINNLTISYQDHNHSLLALDKVNLSLSSGRITALVGESGSGKTTLGKAVMGLLPDNARILGQIDINQKNILDLNDGEMNAIRWSRAAMVFQNGAASFNPVYSMSDQVAEPLIQKGMARTKAVTRANTLLNQMGVDSDQAARYPHELSGGQVQRCLMAMALILNPGILILDEPTAALDAMTRNFIAHVIQALKSQGKAILLITHDLALADQLADDIAVLYLGQIMEYLPGRELLKHPSHPYTLALARSFPAMDTTRDLGGIRGDAFYRMVHAHAKENGPLHEHIHVATPEAVHKGGHAPPQGCIFQPRCTQAVAECTSGDIGFTDAGTHRVRCLRGGIAEILRFKNTAKTYGPVKALLPTDLTVMAGEVFCLVGETGSGKTTLAMIAAGAVQPDQGTRMFHNRDMDDWIKKDYPSLAEKIGIIYQNPAESVSHRFSVFDVVAEPLRVQKHKKDKEDIKTRVLKALADVRLSTAPEFLHRYPHELNMGAIQRLCIARALVHGPDLLIADEPTSALDPSVQAKVLKMLLNLQIDKGLTLLFVTHDIGLARKVGDRIGVMRNGRIVETGTSAQIITHPEQDYTKMLINSARGFDPPDLPPGTVIAPYYPVLTGH